MPRRPSEASQASRTRAGRPSTARPASAVDEAELGGDDHVRAAAGDGPADQRLGRAVNVGGVEHGHPDVDGALDERDRGGIVTGAAGVDVGDPDAHASEANGRDGGSVLSELTGLHFSLVAS